MCPGVSREKEATDLTAYKVIVQGRQAIVDKNEREKNGEKDCILGSKPGVAGL